MKLAMTIDKALEFADEWSRGLTLYEGAQGWRVVCMLLAEEVRRMRSMCKDAALAIEDRRAADISMNVLALIDRLKDDGSKQQRSTEDAERIGALIDSMLKTPNVKVTCNRARRHVRRAPRFRLSGSP